MEGIRPEGVQNGISLSVTVLASLHYKVRVVISYLQLFEIVQ